MPQQFNFPAISATNPSVDSLNQPIPSSATLVGAEDPSGDLQALQIDGSGNLTVSAASLPLPTGAATAALQTTGNTSLATIAGAVAGTEMQVDVLSSALPTGAATEATLAALTSDINDVVQDDGGSISVITGGFTGSAFRTFSVDASGYQNVNIIASGLPAGAATAALQTTGNASLSTIAGAVSGTEMQVDVLTSALPTGAATSALQTTGNTSLSTIAGAVSGTEMQVDVLTSALPTGAATSALQTQISGQLPSALGQTNMAGSLSVAIASNQSALPVAAQTGRARANAPFFNDYSSTSVTTAAYTTAVASLSSAVNMVEVFDSSGQAMILAVGAAASEVDQLYILPGGNGQIPLAIASGARVSIRALTANATSGYILINFYT